MPYPSSDFSPFNGKPFDGGEPSYPSGKGLENRRYYDVLTDVETLSGKGIKALYQRRYSVVIPDYQTEVITDDNFVILLKEGTHGLYPLCHYAACIHCLLTFILPYAVSSHDVAYCLCAF